MNSYPIGDFIKRRREALGLTQEELGDGICVPATLSKIENGHRIPTPRTVIALLQRIGVSSDVYYAFVDENNRSLQDLEREIRRCTAHKQFSEALTLLEKMEQNSQGEPLMSQFILRERALIGYRKDGTIQPYTASESLELLYRAIRLTIPSFQIEHIAMNFLCTEELTVIIDIAATYSEQKNYEMSLMIYAQLMEYVEQHCISMEETTRIVPLITYNYGNDLEEIGNYEKAVKICEVGRNCCISYSKMQLLGEIMATEGSALFKEGHKAEAYQMLLDACSFLRIVGKLEKWKYLKKYAQNLFQAEEDYCTSFSGGNGP